MLATRTDACHARAGRGHRDRAGVALHPLHAVGPPGSFTPACRHARERLWMLGPVRVLVSLPCAHVDCVYLVCVCTRARKGLARKWKQASEKSERADHGARARLGQQELPCPSPLTSPLKPQNLDFAWPQTDSYSSFCASAAAFCARMRCPASPTIDRHHGQTQRDKCRRASIPRACAGASVHAYRCMMEEMVVLL